MTSELRRVEESLERDPAITEALITLATPEEPALTPSGS